MVAALCATFICPVTPSYPCTTEPAPFAMEMELIHGPGRKLNPKVLEIPRTAGMLSKSIWVYFPSNPNILICRVPVIPSVNDASTEPLVSKLSERLQHAALHNSFSFMT